MKNIIALILLFSMLLGAFGCAFIPTETEADASVAAEPSFISGKSSPLSSDAQRRPESLLNFAATDKNGNAQMYFFSAKGKRCYAEIDYPEGCYLVFGRESVGLPEELVAENKERSVRIPMIKDARCLNLSNSVAIATYEVFRQWGFSELEKER